MSRTHLILFVGNHNVIELDGLQNSADESYQNDATVAVTLTDSEGEEVTGDTWPVAMTYVSGSNGKYQGTISNEAALLDGKYYEALVAVETSSGHIGRWTATVKAENRKLT